MQPEWFAQSARDYQAPSGVAAFFTRLFEVFMPRQMCMRYEMDVVWIHLISDTLITLSYFSIPIALIYFVRHRKDLRFNWIFLMFAAFILLCGTTHLFNIVSIWRPYYRLDGVVKLVTGLVSVLTAIQLVPLIPKALKLPSPAELQLANQRMEAEVIERIKAQQDLRHAYDELELRVQERTVELMQTAEYLNTEIIEREKAEKAAAQLAAIVEFSEDAIIGKDLHGIVTSWNRGAENTFGYLASEMVGHSISKLIPPERQLEEDEILAQVAQGQSVRHYETVRLRKDAAIIPVSVTISAIRDAAGNIIGASKVARDISDSKFAEEQLRATLRHVNDLQAALDEHAIVAMTDPKGKITYVNDKFCAISKYSREELLGKDHRIINSSYHSEAFIRDLWQTIGQGQVWHGEIRNRAKDGSLYWVDTTIVPFLDEQGEPRQYVAIRADITSRKLAEEALRESELQFRTMLDAISQLAWMASSDGTIYWYNHRWYYYTGTTSEQMNNSGWQRVHHPDVLPMVIEKWQHSVSSGEPFEMDFPLRAADGSFSWFLTRAFPLKDDNGQITRWYGTNTDISRIRDAEIEIQRLNNDLELRVKERTAQLEQANKELEAFSYSVSHDLRAPLRAIDGFSQAVIEDYSPLLPEEGQNYLQTIRGGAQKMGMLIDDLLTFSRLGRAPVHKQLVNVAQLVQSVLDDFELQREARNIELILGLLPDCQGDTALLRQVWINLISNAFKYTQKRDHTRIEIGCQSAGSAEVYFVRDNGTGFDMRYADKLFGVFHRLHRAEDYEGTGVGLAIVQRIVHRHGGRVWAEAALERGATFYFTLEGESAC